MRIAICFSGLLRTGIESSPNIRRFIGNLWDSCDFFIHTWNMDYYNPLTGESWEQYIKSNTYESMKYDPEKLKKLQKIYRFKKVEIGDNDFVTSTLKKSYSRYIDLNSPDWWVPMFYSWHRSVHLKQQYELENKFQYDFVVKMRPDCVYASGLYLEDVLKKITGNNFGVNQISKDHNLEYTTDDIFYASKSALMDNASKWWKARIIQRQYLNGAKSTYSHFYEYIVSVGGNPVDLDMYYMGEHYRIGLYRKECLMFDPILNFDKCVECDLLHYHTPNSDIKYINRDEVEKMKINTLETRKFVPATLK